MKRIIIFIIAVMTMATIDAQTLTKRQQGLAACACLMAQGDLERLEPAVRMALDNGVTINELNMPVRAYREQYHKQINRY